MNRTKIIVICGMVFCAVFLVGAGRAHAEISFIQANSQVVGTGATSSATHFLSNNIAGGLIISCFRWAGTGSISSISDTRGNTYVAGALTSSTTRGKDQCWYVANIPAGANTTTVVLTSSSTGSIEAMVLEYAGVATSSPLDVVATTSASAAAMTTGTSTTAVSNELIFGRFEDGTVSSTGVGFNSRLVVNGNLAEDSLVNTAGQNSASAVQQASTNYDAIMMTFKPTPAASAWKILLRGVKLLIKGVGALFK